MNGARVTTSRFGGNFNEELRPAVKESIMRLFSDIIPPLTCNPEKGTLVLNEETSVKSFVVIFCVWATALTIMWFSLYMILRVYSLVMSEDEETSGKTKNHSHRFRLVCYIILFLCGSVHFYSSDAFWCNIYTSLNWKESIPCQPKSHHDGHLNMGTYESAFIILTLEFSFYFFESILLFLGDPHDLTGEMNRNKFKYFVHHCVTLFLLLCAVSSPYHLVGVTILPFIDFSDIFMHGALLCGENETVKKNICGGIFGASFIIFRLILQSALLLSSLLYTDVYLSFQLSLYSFFIILFILNVIWSKAIVRIVIKEIKGTKSYSKEKGE